VSLQTPRDIHEILRDEMVQHDRILVLLGEEPRSVMQIATRLNASAQDVMRWMMAMRRYEHIEETGKNGEDGGALYAPREKGERAS